MGNRAIISLSHEEDAPAIYVHWNGGRGSVMAFVTAAQALGVRSPGEDPTYFMSRLGQLIANYFGGTTSIGYGRVNEMDDGDNGLYVVESFTTVKHHGDTLAPYDMDAEVFRGVIMKNFNHFRNIEGSAWKEQAEAFAADWIERVRATAPPDIEDEDDSDE